MMCVEPRLVACGVTLQFGYHGWQTAFQPSCSSILRYQRWACISAWNNLHSYTCITSQSCICWVISARSRRDISYKEPMYCHSVFFKVTLDICSGVSVARVPVTRLYKIDLELAVIMRKGSVTLHFSIHFCHCPTLISSSLGDHL